MYITHKIILIKIRHIEPMCYSVESSAKTTLYSLYSHWIIMPSPRIPIEILYRTVYARLGHRCSARCGDIRHRGAFSREFRRLLLIPSLSYFM